MVIKKKKLFEWPINYFAILSIFSLVLNVMGNTFSSAIAPIVFCPPQRGDAWHSPMNITTPRVIQTLRATPENFVFLRCEPAKKTSKYKPNKTIVFCHGNGADIEQMIPWFHDVCHNLCINIVGVEYAGYGPTQTYKYSSIFAIVRPSENGCTDALESVIGVLKSEGIADSDIHLIGHSLGTGVVANYASRAPPSPNPLILVSPYKSISRVLLDSFIGSWVGLEMFPTHKCLANIHGPVKIFHGDADSLILPSHATYLHNNLQDASLPITWLPGADHNRTLDAISMKDLADALEPVVVVELQNVQEM